jgi:hypothetical protein
MKGNKEMNHICISELGMYVYYDSVAPHSEIGTLTHRLSTQEMYTRAWGDKPQIIDTDRTNQLSQAFY